jgi:hypothetical protein
MTNRGFSTRTGDCFHKRERSRHFILRLLLRPLHVKQALEAFHYCKPLTFIARGTFTLHASNLQCLLSLLKLRFNRGNSKCHAHNYSIKGPSLLHGISLSTTRKGLTLTCNLSIVLASTFGCLEATSAAHFSWRYCGEIASQGQCRRQNLHGSFAASIGGLDVGYKNERLIDQGV